MKLGLLLIGTCTNNALITLLHNASVQDANYFFPEEVSLHNSQESGYKTERAVLNYLVVFILSFYFQIFIYHIIYKHT